MHELGFVLGFKFIVIRNNFGSGMVFKPVDHVFMAGHSLGLCQAPQEVKLAVVFAEVGDGNTLFLLGCYIGCNRPHVIGAAQRRAGDSVNDPNRGRAGCGNGQEANDPLLWRAPE